MGTVAFCVLFALVSVYVFALLRGDEESEEEKRKGPVRPRPEKRREDVPRGKEKKIKPLAEKAAAEVSRTLDSAAESVEEVKGPLGFLSMYVLLPIAALVAATLMHPTNILAYFVWWGLTLLVLWALYQLVVLALRALSACRGSAVREKRQKKEEKRKRHE